MELRAAQIGKLRQRILTKKPLAVYVPADRLPEWQTGRIESTLAAKRSRYPEVTLESHRQYILLYGWVKGHNTVEAAQALGISGISGMSFLSKITLRAIDDLKQLGFRGLDMKPQHILMRTH